MIVETIEGLAAFRRVRLAYEAVHRADPHRNVFTSWSWLASYFETMASHWCVLAARERPGGEYVAFCPLELREMGPGFVVIYRELYIAANPTADYNGIVAAAGADTLAIGEAFARRIDAIRWDNFRANNVNDPRVATVIGALGAGNAIVQQPENGCHYVRLGAAPQSGGRKGRHAYRALRRLEKVPGFRVTEADAASIGEHVDALLALHHVRWNTNLPKARRTYGRLLRASFARGCTRVFGTWIDDVPLAFQAAFVDGTAWGAYMIAYNREYKQFSPGVGIFGATMRAAEAEGYESYDFLRGDEAFKRRFSPETRWLRNWSVHRSGARNGAINVGAGIYGAVKGAARRVIYGRV